jgi:hypothetical protein
LSVPRLLRSPLHLGRNMVELLVAIAAVLLAQGLREPASLHKNAVAPRAGGLTLVIEGTTSALLAPRELRRHSLPLVEVADACFLAGPRTLGELPPPVWLCLQEAYRTGCVRGTEVSRLVAGARSIQEDEALIFVLLTNAVQGPRVHAFVSAAPGRR